MDQAVTFWPEEVLFGPFDSTNRTVATPDQSLGPLSNFFSWGGVRVLQIQWPHAHNAWHARHRAVTAIG